MLKSISPIDGRYAAKTESLQAYLSEYALIKYRVIVEIKYLIALKKLGLPQLAHLDKSHHDVLESIIEYFSIEDAERVKEIESVTNHDVKAVEYLIKEKMEKAGITDVMEFVHFGLTSQDINNTSFPMMIRDAMQEVLFPKMESLIRTLDEHVDEYEGVAMLARTHGQPASPTTLGKEIAVFSLRLRKIMDALKLLPFSGKFGGATGNLNAHKVAFPQYDWQTFADKFLHDSLGLERQEITTQIEHYDDLAALFDHLCRFSTVLIDLARDMWTYISLEYFGQKVVKGEVGSSAMPHKVNPIDFENAEGNLGIGIALFSHLARKLPISRLQRDLTDSTVLRNIGVPLAHLLIACQSLDKGLGKIILNQDKLAADLNDNWAVVAEAIQNILRREGYPKPYEALKDLTRGKTEIKEKDIKAFINGLQVSEQIKSEMQALSPHNYVGYY